MECIPCLKSMRFCDVDRRTVFTTRYWKLLSLYTSDGGWFGIGQKLFMRTAAANALGSGSSAAVMIAGVMGARWYRLAPIWVTAYGLKIWAGDGWPFGPFCMV